MDSFDIISYSSVTKCRVQCHSYLNNTISTIHFFFLLKMYFLAAIMSKNTNKKNRGHRSRFMAKRQHTWEFRLKMIILWKGTGTIFKIGTFSAERSYSDNRYWPVGVRKDLCCLSLGDWTKLSPRFMCQCYAQWSYWNFFRFMVQPRSAQVVKKKIKTNETQQSKNKRNEDQ